MLYDKILAALKAKYQDKRLTDKMLAAIAKRLALTVTKEEDIEAAVTAEADTVAEIQSFADARFAAGEEKGKKPSEEPKPGAGGTNPPPAAADDKGNDPMKLVLQKLDEMQKEITGLKTEKSIDSQRSQLEASLKGTSEAFQKRTLKTFDRLAAAGALKEQAAFDEFVGDVKEEAKDFPDTGTDGGGAKPFHRPAAAGGGTQSKEAPKEVVNNVVDKIM